ncbi:leucine-rich repeat protein, partial [Acinetobacter pittii]|uniref:leucine-rich repeat protein n=1 Tax=Acinetobacter pittii TaxID=48296 RepID=UPI00331D6763
TSIVDYAFYNCTSLTNVTIGNSVTSIGDYVFKNCEKLEKIVYTGTLSQWRAIKGSDNISLIVTCKDTVVANEIIIENIKYRILD